MSPFLLNVANLKSFLTLGFCMPVWMMVLNIAYLIFALLLKSKEKWGLSFVYYAIAAITQDIISMFVQLSNKTVFQNRELMYQLTEYSVIAFELIELLVFYHFFYIQFQRQNVKRLLPSPGKLFTAGLILTGLLLLFIPNALAVQKFSLWVYAVISMLILTLSFYYFYTLFSEPNETLLLQEPAFWITTGIAFLHGINIPVFIVERYLEEMRSRPWDAMYALSYFSYAILFLLLIISLFCSKRKEKQNDQLFIKAVNA